MGEAASEEEAGEVVETKGEEEAETEKEEEADEVVET